MHDREQPLLHRIGALAARAGGGPAQRPRLRAAVRLGVALLVLACLVLAVALQWGDLRDHGVELDPIWVAPAVATLVLLDVTAAFGWDLVLRALGHRLDPVRAQAIWGKSLIARYVPGGVLMVVGRVLLSEREGVPRRTTMASLVYEQGLMIVAAVLISLSVLIGSDTLGEGLRIVLLVAAPLLLALMHPKVLGPLANAVLRAFGRDPLPRVLPMRVVLELLVFYLLVWAVFAAGTFFAARSVFDAGLDDFPALTTAQGIGYSAALVTVVFPGGLGVRDGAFALVLAPALGEGFAFAAAIAIAVRLLVTVGEVVYVAAVIAADRHRAGAQPLRAAT